MHLAMSPRPASRGAGSSTERGGRLLLAPALAALAVGVLASMLGPAAALASYVSKYSYSNGDTEITYYAEFLDTDFGKSNYVDISGTPQGNFTVTDTPEMQLAVGPGCFRGPAGSYQAYCPGSDVSWVNMFFGEGDDHGVTQIVGARALLDGGNGNDTLTGGDGLDFLHGGSGDDTLNGWAGQDSLWPEGGSDQLTGGGDVDFARYDNYWTPVTVSLNGQADDGAFGERQNAHTESVISGNAGDTLIGSKGANTRHGMDGDDVIEGRAGADHLIGHTGNDTIYALDRTTDSVSCGDGYDQVLADRRDDVFADCEAVSRP
jgi:Ca2+-binding RTX toxin-like protein